MRIGRSILAIFAGFVFVAALSTVTDVVLNKVGIFPALGQRMPDRLLVIALAYRTLFSIGGSYITARIAPYRPMLHAFVGALIGLAIGTLGVFVTWNNPMTQGAHWYAIAVALVGLPAAWVGGKIWLAQLDRTVR